LLNKSDVFRQHAELQVTIPENNSEFDLDPLIILAGYSSQIKFVNFPEARPTRVEIRVDFMKKPFREEKAKMMEKALPE